MAQIEELFFIKDINTNRYYIEDLRRDKNWTLDIQEATGYSSYNEASFKLSTDNDIPEGMYQIDKIFKKPEVEYYEE